VNFYYEKPLSDMGVPEVEAFLTDLAVNGMVSLVCPFGSGEFYRFAAGSDIPYA
jgi:hypothetical protein